MRISYSSLENFQNCPQKYKFSEIDKLKEPKSKEAVFGSYLHRVLYWFLKNDPLFPTLEGLLTYYRQNWPEKEEGFSWQDKEEEKAYFEEGLRILRNYFSQHNSRESIILDLESRFEAIIDETPDKPGGKHILSGIIDRIDKLPDGTLEIIDYKTGKRISSQEEVDNSLQLSLYALGLKERWPKIKTKDLRLSLYFLKNGEKIETSRSEEDLEKVRLEVINLIQQIQKSSFQPKPSPLCHWCGFRPICPVWRHLYEKEKNFLNGLDIDALVDEYFVLKNENKKMEEKMEELRNLIDIYCDTKGLKRVFGSNGYFNRSVKNKISYDKKKIKAVLEPLEKWEEVLIIDEEKLTKIMKEIPNNFRQKIEEAKIVKKEQDFFEAVEITKKEINDSFK